jgi:putative SbcD/Mre11-related phosphoesterase
MDYQLIKDSRAMLAGEYLVIADLHIGYAKTLEARGYNIPSQIKSFLKEIKELKAKTGASKLILLGDIKHNVPKADIGEKYDVPKFFYELSDMFEKIIVIKGNHDGRIELMIHPKNIEVKKEFVLGDLGFIHGHSYPSEELMSNCKVLVMGHIHPVFKVVDRLCKKHYYPCWLISSLNKKKLERYDNITVEKVIVVPVFNQIFTGYEKFAGPLAKALRKQEIFLLDLTKVK